MKKLIISILVISIVTGYPLNAQSGLLKKVTKSVANEIGGKPEKEKAEPEPACASDQATVIMDLGGKLKIDYKELTISILSDGRILAQHAHSDEYYVVKDGVTSGPYKSGDPAIADFVPADGDKEGMEALILRNKPYLSKSGDKFLITFGGKSYGPFGQINDFAVSKSKDKFAAMVIENILVNEDQAKKMEAAIKNAKTDQERMDLSMKYAQQMQNSLMKGGGATSILPKLVTNIPNTSFDPSKAQGGSLNGNIKFDDILMTSYDKIMDLQGKTLLTIKQELIGAKDIFVNSSNTKYAVYDYGTLTFSDNTTMSDLFNPRLIKADGKVFLAYMYYSPRKNAIMQHKIAF